MVAEAERKDELARAEGLKKIPRTASWGEVALKAPRHLMPPSESFWDSQGHPSKNTKGGGMGVAFRHRERGLKNFCNKLLEWECLLYPGGLN